MSTDVFGLLMVAITAAMQLRRRVNAVERAGWLGLSTTGALMTQLDSIQYNFVLSCAVGAFFVLGNAALLYSFYHARKVNTKTEHPPRSRGSS
jgi:hypothetical protein